MIIKKEASMFYNAKPELYEKAKVLRNKMTPAEVVLWDRIRNNQLGVRFKPQHPIDIFIADFYCHKFKLVIEIDGEIHNSQTEYDIGRTAEMESYGITVIRFTNDEIFNELERVMGEIRKCITELTS
ncbi:endonuclease domain-containing protein [Parabacteroides sp. FAFU027]|uniref:endonuclease domain-containing protein n=1 Tax=Parabacteroides sp. FAFU027 TaxID=2922715 RepID=UPI001FAFC3B4|nr:DUF559 domain-containing protein [Parabacteroides sp. FAFU027]